MPLEEKNQLLPSKHRSHAPKERELHIQQANQANFISILPKQNEFKQIIMLYVYSSSRYSYVLIAHTLF